MVTTKCKSLHLGRFNPGHVHNMNGHSIERISQEKDLGVIKDEQLKFHDHTFYTINRANCTLGIIKKSS